MEISPEMARQATEQMRKLTPEQLQRLMGWSQRLQKGVEAAKVSLSCHNFASSNNINNTLRTTPENDNILSRPILT